MEILFSITEEDVYDYVNYLKENLDNCFHVSFPIKEKGD